MSHWKRLARAVVTRPKVLLMDEPLSNLDARLRDQMRDELRRIAESVNVTSLYVTHDQAEALSLGDRVCVMDEGETTRSTPEARPSRCHCSTGAGACSPRRDRTFCTVACVLRLRFATLRTNEAKSKDARMSGRHTRKDTTWP